MAALRFTWDTRKAAENVRKHGVSFGEAVTVFLDDSARLMCDPDHSDEEDRFVLLGMSAEMNLLVACHSYLRDYNEIRIVSARRATRTERSRYGSFL